MSSTVSSSAGLSARDTMVQLISLQPTCFCRCMSSTMAPAIVSRQLRSCKCAAVPHHVRCCAVQARLRNDVLREAASTDQRLLVAREAARSGDREAVPDGDMEDDFEPVAGTSGRLQGLAEGLLGASGDKMQMPMHSTCMDKDASTR